MKKQNTNLSLFLELFFFSFLLFTLCFLSAEISSAEVTVTAEVLIVCGNSIVESGEQCDKANLNGQDCLSLGYGGGTLGCELDCTFNTSSCTPGGGRREYYIPPQTTVIFEGIAYPQSTVTLLKDAQIAGTTIAGNDANFQMTLSELSGGNYIFGVYSEDKEGRVSSLLVFPINVTSGATTKVSGIFIAPTIAVDKSEVEKGQDLLLFGYSAPKADIRIFIKSKEKEFSVNTIADNEGKYKYSLNTASLNFEQYRATVIAFVNNLSSNFSRIIYFIVGKKTVIKKPFPECPPFGDFNDDCRVNLIDFSILIYWFDRPNPPARIDLSEDGRVDLVDFSIMAYYWTG